MTDKQKPPTPRPEPMPTEPITPQGDSMASWYIVMIILLVILVVYFLLQNVL